MTDRWVRFEGYDGRYDAGYGGGYVAGGIRFPYIEESRTWDIVRVDGAPVDGRHPVGSYVVLARGFDMMGKAHGEYQAYRLHFKRCPGVGRCQDIGHPGGPRRSAAQGRGLPEAKPAPPKDEPVVAAERGGPVAPADPAVSASAGATAAERIASLLLPASSDLSRRHLGDGVTLDVVPLRFQLWSGPPLGMSEDCNKRGGRVVGEDGDLSCAEVEIVRRLRAVGWDAAWVSPFRCGERRWGRFRLDPSALPATVRALEARIGMGRAGRPDVVAWNGGRVCYLESKGPADSIRPTQVTWFAAALRAGLAEGDLALVEWRPA